MTRLLYQRSIEQKKILHNHRKVQNYLKNKEQLKIDLSEIFQIINKNEINNPYNIYITNKNLVIKNTTYKPDMNFDLSFAKASFDKRHKENILDSSSPYYKKEKKQFFSYTDSYFIKDGKKDGVLQLSYTYQNTKKQYEKILKLIQENPNIKDLRAYMASQSQHISQVSFIKISEYHPTLKDMLQDIENGNKIKSNLTSVNYVENIIIKNNQKYKNILILTESTLFDKSKIMYSILLDENELENDLILLNYIMGLITVLGVITIVIISLIRAKETKLTHQDKFVQNSMHEIRTPLSIITLNNELRQIEFGEDEYSNEIESALKTLQNSYDDMSFIVTQNTQQYPVEIFLLRDTLNERLHYFKTIASSFDITMNISIKSTCKIKISSVELIRLIDNNLSNAIKYSSRNSDIFITLQDNILSFKNFGNTINNTSEIFDKYSRENNIIGGYGLGLSIVKNITQQYNIDISVSSDAKNGNIFTYTFKSHLNDISQT